MNAIGSIVSYINGFDKDKEATLMYGLCIKDLISEVCKIKEINHPGFTKRQSSLVSNITKLEDEIGMTLYPYQIDSVFWVNFKAFLKDQKLCNNTINLLTDQLKSILDCGSFYGSEVSTTYDDYSRECVVMNTIALTADEVSAIYHFNIKDLKVYHHGIKKYRKMRCDKVETLTRVKDMFVLSCNLGQRYSDMIRISKDNFHNNIFKIVQQKTGSVAELNIDRMSIDPGVTYKILKKYNYCAPFSGDINSYNKYLKELFVKTDIDKKLTIDYLDENGVLSKKQIAKVSKISSHVARRTFCTENYRRRQDCEELRRATGHQDEDNMITYIKTQLIHV